MTSISDVAKKAGVSKSTVSLVINGKGRVSDKTRKKIELAMKEMNYVPSILARNLSKSQSNIIGIIVPNIAHPFFSTFLYYAERELSSKGYMTMVTGTVGREEVEKSYLSLLEKRAMDGIIMGVHSLDVTDYTKIDRPIVSIDRYISDNIPVISTNHLQAAELVVQVLSQKRLKKVVQFVGTKSVSLTSNEFSSFLKKEFQNKGVELVTIPIGFNSFRQEDYDNAAQKLFDTVTDFDAVVGVDMVIAAVAKIANDRRINIPGELQLVAYDGTYVTQLGNNNFTSIKQPIKEMAKLAVDKIIQSISGENLLPIKNELDVILVKGETTIR